MTHLLSGEAFRDACAVAITVWVVTTMLLVALANHILDQSRKENENESRSANE